jgi:hypothetical protein
MSRTKRLTAAIALAALIACVGALQGCAPKGDAFKQELMNALEKQQEIRSSRFQGSAEIMLPTSVGTGGALSLFSYLANSRLAWDGVQDSGQNRMELDLSIASAGVEASIPLMLADNRLYFHIPVGALSNIDLYFDYAQAGGATIADFNRLYLDVLTRFVDALDGKWFTAGEDNGARTIHIPINRKNWPDVRSALDAVLPDVVGMLQGANLIRDAQAEQWLKELANEPLAERLDGFTINEPGGLTFTLGDDGYVHAYAFEWDVQRNDDASSRMKIRWSNRLSDIGAPPSFEKPIPEEARSINALLGPFLNGCLFGGSGKAE